MFDSLTNEYKNDMLQEAYDVIKILNSDRLNNYYDWWAVGRILFNIDPSKGKKIWIKWTSKSTSFDKKEIDYLWNRYESNKKNITVLYRMALEDNKDKFFLIIKKTFLKDLFCNIRDTLNIDVTNQILNIKSNNKQSFIEMKGKTCLASGKIHEKDNHTYCEISPLGILVKCYNKECRGLSYPSDYFPIDDYYIGLLFGQLNIDLCNRIINNDFNLEKIKFIEKKFKSS